MLDKKQKAFLKLVMTPEEKGTNSFTAKISKLVEEAKQNSQWRKQFMDLEREKARKFREGKAEGLLEGKSLGMQEKAEEDAIALLKEGDSPEKVSRCIGLPLEKVLELKESISVKA